MIFKKKGKYSKECEAIVKKINEYNGEFQPSKLTGFLSAIMTIAIGSIVLSQINKSN